MTLITRDDTLERDTLERVGRVAQEPWFALAVQMRLDAVEDNGGPDGGGSTRSVDALQEAYDEYIDGPAWSIIALNQLLVELAAGDRDEHTCLEVRLLVEEAMAHAAHAAHLMKGAVALLEGA